MESELITNFRTENRSLKDRATVGLGFATIGSASGLVTALMSWMTADLYELSANGFAPATVGAIGLTVLTSIPAVMTAYSTVVVATQAGLPKAVNNVVKSAVNTYNNIHDKIEDMITVDYSSLEQDIQQNL